MELCADGTTRGEEAAATAQRAREVVDVDVDEPAEGDQVGGRDDYSPVLVASIDPSRNCSEPPTTPPAVLDCNDVRATLWVEEMIGSCAMPPLTPHPSVAAPRRQRGGGSHDAMICHGADCMRDPLPLTSGSDEQGPSWLLSSSPHRLHVDLRAALLSRAAFAHPSSAPERRNERPPKSPA